MPFRGGVNIVHESTIEQRTREVLRSVLGAAAGSLENPSTDGVAAWDSLKHVELIFALEDAFDVTFDEAEMERLTSLDAIVAALRAKA